MDIRTKTPAFLHQNKNRQQGQGMTEYIIIVALIAIAAIGAFGFFGDTVREQTAGLAEELSGGSGAANIASAQLAANSATSEASEHRTMGNYNNNAQAGSAGAD